MSSVRRWHVVNPVTFQDTGSVFTGSTPANAAKKAASAGITSIVLRESNTRGVFREYRGSKKTLSTPTIVRMTDAKTGKVKMMRFKTESKARYVRVHRV